VIDEQKMIKICILWVKMDQPIVLYSNNIHSVSTFDFKHFIYRCGSQQLTYTQSELLRDNDIAYDLYPILFRHCGVWQVKKFILYYRLFLLKNIILHDVARYMTMINYQLLYTSYQQHCFVTSHQCHQRIPTVDFYFMITH